MGYRELTENAAVLRRAMLLFRWRVVWLFCYAAAVANGIRILVQARWWSVRHRDKRPAGSLADSLNRLMRSAWWFAARTVQRAALAFTFRLHEWRGRMSLRLRGWRERIAARHQRLRAVASLMVFERIRRSSWAEELLGHLSVRAMHGDSTGDELVGLIGLAAGLGRTEEAAVFATQLVERFPLDISFHHNAAAKCFLEGRYDLAEQLWRDSAETRESAIKEKGLDELNLRFLGPTWFIAIGHIAHLDTYFKHQILQGQTRKLIPVIPAHINVPNEYLLGLWEPFFVEERRRDIRPLRLNLESIVLLTDEFWSLRFGPGDTSMFSYAAARVQRRWREEKRGPLVELTAEDKERGWRILEKLGVARGSRLVCVHVREPGFHNAWDRKHPGTRNADPRTYSLAIEALAERGATVIRLGDKSMTPMPRTKGLIDYAYSDAKSEFMDVFLCASCIFFIGTNSGLGLVPPLFGVPCALTNWSPIGLPQWYPGDLFIPKLVYSGRLRRPLTFTEMFGTDAGWSQFDEYFEKNELDVIDNTPEDLRDLVIEMFDRIDGGPHYSEQDTDLLKRYEAIALEHGSYLGAQMGVAFLRKYGNLLD